MPRPHPLTIMATIAIYIYNSCRTCLINCMGSISCHITTLVIISLVDRHIHTHTYWQSAQDQFQETKHALAWGQHAPGLKMTITKLASQLQNRRFALMWLSIIVISCYKDDIVVITWDWGRAKVECNNNESVHIMEYNCLLSQIK